jgi:hypothetical protein
LGGTIVVVGTTIVVVVGGTVVVVGATVVVVVGETVVDGGNVVVEAGGATRGGRYARRFGLPAGTDFSTSRVAAAVTASCTCAGESDGLRLSISTTMPVT